MKNFTHYIVIVTGLLFVPHSLHAQDNVRPVQGVLLEKGTRRPLADVNLFLQPHNLRSVSNAKGEFEFMDVPIGAAQLIVNSAGYQRLDKNFEVQESAVAPIKLRLFLERERYGGEFETTVVGKANERESASKSLTQEQFLNLPGAGGDAIKAVANLAGVNRTSGFSSVVVIQGSAPDETRYTIDGHEVPIIFHFGGLSTVVFSEAIGRVDYLSAGYGPEYSRALGGQVGVWTRSPRRDRWHGMAFVDLINAGALLEGDINDKSSFLISARQSYIGEVLNAVAGDDEDFNFTAAPRYTDLTGLYELKVNDTQFFKITALASQDSLEFLLKNPVNLDPALRGNFRTLSRFMRIIPQYRWQPSDDFIARLSTGAGWDSLSFEGDENSFFLKLWLLTPKFEVEQQINSWWRTYNGMDHSIAFATVELTLPTSFNSGGINNPFAAGTEQRVDTRGVFYDIGFYSRNVLHNPNSPWTYNIGLRFDYFSTTHEAFVDPRLGIEYAFDASLKAKILGGLYHQAPSEREISPDVGNPDLTTPSAWHLAAGIDKDFRRGGSNGWTVSLGTFARWFDDLVVSSNQLTTTNGVSKPEYFNNSEEGVAYGAETSATYKLQPWSLRVAYTLLDSYRSQPALGEYPAAFDQTHNLNLIGSIELPNNWQISSRFRLVTGNPNTPIIGSFYDADNDVYIPLRGPLYSERLDPFMQLDVRIDKKWIYDAWILSLYLDIQNITNNENIESVRYAYDYSQTVNITGLPVIPTLGLKGEF